MLNRPYPYLLAALLSSVTAAAAAAAPPSPDEKAEARLNAVLAEWAKASDAVREAHFIARMTETDSFTETKRETAVEVFVKRPDLMRVDYHSARDGDVTFLFAAGVAHLIAKKDKTDGYCTISSDFGFPQEPGRYPDDWRRGLVGSFLERQSWLAFGPPVRDLKADFDLRITKESADWIYLEIKPRGPRDKDAVRRAEVVLNAHTFLLRRLWFEQIASEVTYDFHPTKEGPEQAVSAGWIRSGIPDDYRRVDLGWLVEGAKGSAKP